MKNEKYLLGLSTPSYRQAYSDRTCWIMSYLSELAYIKFNPLMPNTTTKDYFIKKLESLIDEDRIKGLVGLINETEYDHKEEELKLINKTKDLDLNLIKTFDKNGTQAILVGNEDWIALAFRGTEATSIKDIKADCNAFLTTCDNKGKGKIHSGFNSAYLDIATEIEKELSNKDKPLYITGHSLGGALATVAAKKLDYKKIAACYTFGTPRVGNEDWVVGIKTPIYRIVNAADCVTMLPLSCPTINILAWLIKKFISKAIGSCLLKYFGGYYHGGNMRYLTNCAKGNYDSVRLLYSVDIFRRILGWGKKYLAIKKFLADHSIAIYRKKLAIVACRRN